ncbi:sensor histidine kinase [Hyphobacterium marinum]|uniref:histidine kinase n=1 Tax=Hyphobacterium marinum TaxID=3116574 RepID=A0ABU7M1K0_9PROT|nr:sensor histidine kinase [Hyphobacterium sp. Y6023]MEE2567698.1 sensor histidine kinase [Hyphobacterium sp. Y6023]
MIDVSELPRRRFGLRLRLLVLVALSLSPIFILAGIQTWIDVGEERENLELELVATARLLAHDQEVLLRSSADIMRVLSGVPAVANLTSDCPAVMRLLPAQNRAYTNFAIMGLDGRTLCSGIPVTDTLNVSNREWFQQVIAEERFVIGRSQIGVVTGESVITAAVPFYQNGELAGAMITGIRVSVIQQLGIDEDDRSGLIAGIVDSAGQVVTERRELSVDIISPQHLRAAAEGEVHVFERENPRSGRRILALASLIEDDVFVLLSAPRPSFLSWRSISVWGTIVLPLLMWAIALIAIWIAADFLVLRWVSYLTRIARLYGHGRYDVVPMRAQNAPRELRELADSFQWMAERIAERDEELTDAVEHQQILIREVHHRVKNNLQIITSLLNLQLGNVKEEQAVRALKEAQSRINALAMVHRNLYEAEDLRYIVIAPFFSELCRLTHQAGPGEDGGIKLDFQTNLGDEVISTDQAVPLAMFVTEAMTNAYKHAFNDLKDGHTLTVSVNAVERDGKTWIEAAIADNGPGFDMSAPRRRGVGSSLFEAFAMQLDGESEVVSAPGEGMRISLVFPYEQDDPAE